MFRVFYALTAEILLRTADSDFPWLITPTQFPCLHVVCRNVKVVKKPADRGLFIGVSAPGIQPRSDGWTSWDLSSYGMWSYGEVRAAGQRIIDDYTELPTSSIIQADQLKQRADYDKVFRAGDEVVVVLDCTAHTLRLQSPTVQHVIPIQQQHHQQQWVLNVNFGRGEHQITVG